MCHVIRQTRDITLSVIPNNKLFSSVIENVEWWRTDDDSDEFVVITFTATVPYEQ